MNNYCLICKCKGCGNSVCDNGCEYCEDGDKRVYSCQAFNDSRLLPKGLKFSDSGDIVEE